MKKIRWGIIGCGDVTEVKSGPAFNKVADSELIAVMRRNAAKAEDYAKRHHVPKWYDDANKLIHDADINAIYVATPPSTHEEYAIAALRAGKPVYVEKPMTMNTASAENMARAVKETNGKLVVAHYRRGQPLFQKIKQLINDKAIGETRLVRLSLYKKSLSSQDMAVEKTAWRIDPAFAGGGLFHDLAPHQLDLLYCFFGNINKATGIASNQAGLYAADDIVTGTILFQNGVHFSGTWCFNVSAADEKDECEIVGEKGTIIFSFFEQHPITVMANGSIEKYSFDPLQHVQQPMIGNVVDYFLDRRPNPCSAEEGVEVMKLIDSFTAK
ncbi:Gfo/Idh/MocA family protein [Terrimonas pollutisoli]|uniref:Gfo/Idh/MocA family protein n=1 Tax=Terrimonas pollutisoli TaxID=3034147 RepID=UPI0023EC280F|nr:Gfo/Idh/MocA family oxidoreductase [Terrimonas sp. H1YJ31]